MKLLNLEICVFSLLSLFVTAINKPVYSQSFEIIGEVDSAYRDKITISYSGDVEPIYDSAPIEDRKFRYKFNAIDSKRVYLMWNHNDRFDFFYTEPVTYVRVKKDIQKSYVENPSLDQKDFLTWDRYVSDFNERKNTLDSMLKKNNELYLSEKNNKKKLVYKERIDSLEKQLDSTTPEKRIDLDYDILADNPRSLPAIESLARRLVSSNGAHRFQEGIDLYERLPDDIKKGHYGQYLSRAIAMVKQRRGVNVYAYSFDVSDVEKRNVKLADFKGKYILLDFWTSWCVPCREIHPDLKRIYEQYKDGLEIVSFSFDTDLDAWKKAIEHDGVGSWIHVSSEMNKSNDLGRNYQVATYPVKILLDKEGKIMKRWEGAENEIEELTKILSEKLD